MRRQVARGKVDPALVWITAAAALRSPIRSCPVTQFSVYDKHECVCVSWPTHCTIRYTVELPTPSTHESPMAQTSTKRCPDPPQVTSLPGLTDRVESAPQEGAPDIWSRWLLHARHG